MQDIAFFQFSTEEDFSYVLEFSGLDLSGRSLEIKVKDRASNTTRATLTNGSGVTISGSNVVEAAQSKASMVTWPRGEYSADVVDVTDGAHSRIMAVRFVYDLPGRLVQGVQNRKAFINWSPNQAVVTATGAIGPAGPPGPIGEGWSPVLSVVTDGTRRVLRITDWVGGTEDKPATGQYVGASGLVSDIASAVDIRGSQGAQGIQGNVGNTGAQGDKGWSPATAIVNDGARRVLQVVDWVGGAGTKPGTGYVGATGLVSNIVDGIDIRGPQGPSGSVVDGDKGDIAVSGGGTAWAVKARAVGFTKTVAIATSRLLGRKTAGSGDIEELTPSDARSILQITAQGETLILATDAATQRAAISVAAQVAAKSGAYSVVAADYGKSFVATGAASWTFGLLAAATATSAFWCEIRNSGSGKVTIDPNGAESVNGVATLVLYPGETVKLLCDGTNWHALFGRSEVLIAGTSLAGTGSALASIDEALPADFMDFELNMSGLTPVLGSAALGMRFSIDGGATYLTSSYTWYAEYVSSGTTTNPASYLSTGSSFFGATGVEMTPGSFTTTTTHNTFRTRIMPGRAANMCPTVEGVAAYGVASHWFTGGYYAGFGRATNVRVLFSGGGGNIAAGMQYTLTGRRPLA